MSQTRRWIFTLNNYSEEDVKHFKALSDVVTYVVFGKEVGENGTPHLQGYLELKTKRRMKGVKELLCDRVHLEIARGTQEENKAYCSKQDVEFFERGDAIKDGASYQVQRWEDAHKAAVEGRLDDIPRDMFYRAKRSFEEVCSQHARDREEEEARAQRVSYELRNWQIEAMKVIEGVPDTRKVYFYVDERGNAGKSTFCHDIIDDPKVWVTEPKKDIDIRYEFVKLKTLPRVVIFDCPRATSNTDMPWSFVEALKNGYVSSGKYEGGCRKFARPTVIIFCNSKLWLKPGGESIMSEDRIVEINL